MFLRMHSTMISYSSSSLSEQNNFFRLISKTKDTCLKTFSIFWCLGHQAWGRRSGLITTRRYAGFIFIITTKMMVRLKGRCRFWHWWCKEVSLWFILISVIRTICSRCYIADGYYLKLSTNTVFTPLQQLQKNILNNFNNQSLKALLNPL